MSAMARQLVLLGAGQAHLHLLAQMARAPWAGVQITLVTQHARHLYSSMVPDYVAGHSSADDCQIPLEPMVKQAGIRWLRRNVAALDANTQRVRLDDGSELPYDWLSINTDPIQDRARLDQALPGAREHALFLRPLEAFGALWPQVLEMGKDKTLRIAIAGAGAAGIELAMAMRQCQPKAAITLLCGNAALGAGQAASLQARLKAALVKRKITLLPDSAAGFQSGAIVLASGATLACDVPILATGAQAPAWLQGSGLALDPQGYVALDVRQRSSSHAQVFMASNTLRAGPALTQNLKASLAGQPLQAVYKPAARTLHLISCGDRQAIASWGGYSAQGRVWWWLKQWLNRRFIHRYVEPFVHTVHSTQPEREASP